MGGTIADPSQSIHSPRASSALVTARTLTIRASLDGTPGMPRWGDGRERPWRRSWAGLVPAAERRNENDCGTTEGEDPQLSVCFPADKDPGSRTGSTGFDLCSGDPPRRRVDCARERISRHAPSPVAAHRRAAFARARDTARPRRLRDAVLRRAVDGPERGAARDEPLLGRGSRRRGGRARPAGRQGSAPLRRSRGEGRRGLGRLDRGRDRAAGAAGAPRRACRSSSSSPTSASASTRRTVTAA